MNQISTIKRIKIFFLFCLAFVIALSAWVSSDKTEAGSKIVAGGQQDGAKQEPKPAQQPKKNPLDQQGQRKGFKNEMSAGCVVCHVGVESMHFDDDEELDIGCSDCHGGDPTETLNKKKAHVQPRNEAIFKEGKTGTPERLAALWNQESDEFVRFTNPGDFRAADLACGKCHERETMWMKKSMMTHGGMLWGAALYNNGAFPIKDARFGESYGPNGQIQRIFTNPAPSPEETLMNGILGFLNPIP
jgi:hypothetical protein